MGCGYDFACHTCKKSYYLGYGSYSSWMTFETVEDFDKAGTAHGRVTRQLRKNENIRECLIEHRGHSHSYVGWDWSSSRGGVLYSETGEYGAEEPWIQDWGEWEKIDLAAD